MRDTAWFNAETLSTGGADGWLAGGRSGGIVMFLEAVYGAEILFPA
jgi:hypothetical protein